MNLKNRRLKNRRLKNRCLKSIVADLTLDVSMLKEVTIRNF
ncbi:unnamed protein product [Acidithrix sp. C25]|nr:unnamed protein product [Acidithrix sp. C25]